MPATVATVLSVNVGRAREFDYNGRSAKSAIWKSPVAGRIAARGVNLEGDDQGKWKVSGFACLIFSARTVEKGVKLDKDKYIGFAMLNTNEHGRKRS